MTYITIRTWLCALSSALLFMGITGAANASVVATFLDPGSTSFTFSDNGNNGDGIGSLDAYNNDIEVNLPLLGLLFTDASYTMTDSGGNLLDTTSQIDAGSYVLSTFESGIITIKTDIAQHTYAADTVLLSATFTSATGYFGNVSSADNTFDATGVTFSGIALNGLTATNEQFAFSSTNIDPLSAIQAPADMEAWTSTTSFTSSATLVPVPAAVWLFGSGLLGLVGMARRKKAA